LRIGRGDYWIKLLNNHYDGGNVGAIQPDMFQQHGHFIPAFYGSYSGDDDIGYALRGRNNSLGVVSLVSLAPIEFLSGVPRTGFETKPVSGSVIFVISY